MAPIFPRRSMNATRDVLDLVIDAEPAKVISTDELMHRGGDPARGMLPHPAKPGERSGSWPTISACACVLRKGVKDASEARLQRL